MGQIETLPEQEVLVKQDEKPPHLYPSGKLIISSGVRVQKSGRENLLRENLTLSKINLRVFQAGGQPFLYSMIKV